MVWCFFKVFNILVILSYLPTSLKIALLSCKYCCLLFVIFGLSNTFFTGGNFCCCLIYFLLPFFIGEIVASMAANNSMYSWIAWLLFICSTSVFSSDVLFNLFLLRSLLVVCHVLLPCFLQTFLPSQ